MSKAVMLSVRPKWCEKIVNSDKTIEVRKTRPKLETPFKCYIYCTKPKYEHEDFICTDYPKPQFYGGGKVIGEFTFERIAIIAYDGGELSSTTNAAFSPAMCLTQAEIIAYIGDKGRCYGWHISDLKIYDTPKELSKFSRPFENCIDKVCDEFGCASCENGGHIKRPPQSWCYVEVTEDV